MEAADFWKKIKTILSQKKKTFEWLCEEAGLSTQVMRNRVYKERIPCVEDTLRLLSALDISIEEFYGIKKQSEETFSDNNVYTIPVVDQCFSAGHGQFVPDYEKASDYISVPTELNHLKGQLGACKVRGDSMEPTLYDGDTLICDNLGYAGDGIYTIIYKGMGFVKRLQQTSDGVKIISDNKIYDPMYESKESEDFKVIGKVRYVLHRI